MIIEDGILKEVYDSDFENGNFFFPEEVTQIGDDAFYSIKSLKTIHPAIYGNEFSLALLEKLGISEPSKIDQAKNGIIKCYILFI